MARFGRPSLIERALERAAAAQDHANTRALRVTEHTAGDFCYRAGVANHVGGAALAFRSSGP